MWNGKLAESKKEKKIKLKKSADINLDRPMLTFFQINQNSLSIKYKLVTFNIKFKYGKDSVDI